MQCIGSIESCPSHHLDEKATILMKYSFALFAFASSVLLSGCSKPSEPQPEIVRPLVKDSRLLVKELGVVKLTNQTPSRNDLGDGKVCIINPVLRADGNLELSMLIELSGTNAAPRRIAAPSVIASNGQPVEIAIQNMAIALTPTMSR
jgi:hypothetical protein